MSHFKAGSYEQVVHQHFADVFHRADAGDQRARWCLQEIHNYCQHMPLQLALAFGRTLVEMCGLRRTSRRQIQIDRWCALLNLVSDAFLQRQQHHWNAVMARLEQTPHILRHDILEILKQDPNIERTAMQNAEVFTVKENGTLRRLQQKDELTPEEMERLRRTPARLPDLLPPAGTVRLLFQRVAQRVWSRFGKERLQEELQRMDTIGHDSIVLEHDGLFYELTRNTIEFLLFHWRGKYYKRKRV